MNNNSTLRNKASNFFDQDMDLSGLIPFHKWLLICGSVLIFVVLPLLFIWGSLGIIHPPVYGQYRVLTDTDHLNQTVPSFKAAREAPIE